MVRHKRSGSQTPNKKKQTQKLKNHSSNLSAHSTQASPNYPGQSSNAPPPRQPSTPSATTSGSICTTQGDVALITLPTPPPTPPPTPSTTTPTPPPTPTPTPTTPPCSNSNSPPPSPNNYDGSIYNIDDGSNSGFNYDDDDDAACKLAIAISLSETPQHAANSEIIASSAAEFLGKYREIIPADGLCMFRCLAAEALERHEFDGDHLKMKKVLIDYICRNWEFFSSFFLQNEEGEQPVGEKAREYYSTKEAYRASMMNSNEAWGGSAELVAFEAIFGLKVYTMKVTKKGFSLSNMDGNILAEFDIEDPTRHDDVPKGVYLYHAGGTRGTHFDRLKDAADEEEEQQEEEKEKEKGESGGGGSLCIFETATCLPTGHTCPCGKSVCTKCAYEKFGLEQGKVACCRGCLTRGGNEEEEQEQEQVSVEKNKGKGKQNKGKGKKNKGKGKNKKKGKGKKEQEEGESESESEKEEEEREREREREREKEASKKEARERGQDNIVSVDMSKDGRMSVADLDTMIKEIALMTGNNEFRTAILDLLKKLKIERNKLSIASPVVTEKEEEEEDEVVDFRATSNEGRLMFIIEKDGTKRVALLVSAMSKTGKLENKLATDWEGPNQSDWAENLINEENWPSQEQAKEAKFLAGGVRLPDKPLLFDLHGEVLDYDKDDNWKFVMTLFDLDFIDATVSGRTAADIFCAILGNSKVAHQHRFEGVDGTTLRLVVGDNVVIGMTPRDAVRLQEFCENEGGRLLMTCNHAGQPARFFNHSSKSVPHGVLRAFLCQEDVFVRLVGYGMNMRLDVRGLTVMKKLRTGVEECKQFEIPTAWTTREESDFKTAMHRPMHCDFSAVVPMDRVAKDGNFETRVVLQEKIEGAVTHNQLRTQIFPIGQGDGIKTGTVTIKKVRSR